MSTPKTAPKTAPLPTQPAVDARGRFQKPGVDMTPTPAPKDLKEREARKQNIPPKPTTDLTCVARTVVCYDNSGNRNFRIYTLKIEDGIVTSVQASDPFANFEAIARMELMNEISVNYLNNRWENGKALET